MTEHDQNQNFDEIISEEASGSGNSPESGVNSIKEEKVLKTVYEYFETFCYALVLMILLFMFVFRYVSVDGPSMMETLHDSDKLVISHINYIPKTGDIVVIRYSPNPIIKRIIATGGQKVKIDYANWEVYVDGVKLDDASYVNRVSGDMNGYKGSDEENKIEEFTVKEGYVFVMGDNRNNSWDSRAMGELNEKDILGRVIFRVFPISKFGKVN